MILNEGVVIPAASLFKEMQDSEFTFHITGSRYTGGARPDSDWDFIAEDSPALVEWLDVRNFEPTRSFQYGQPSGDAVTRTVLERVADDESRVQVQLTDRVNIKLWMREQLTTHPVFAPHYRLENSVVRAAVCRALAEQGVFLFNTYGALPTHI